MPGPVRRGVRRFLAILDSETVAPFQAVFYVFFTLGSIYLLGFTIEPIESIERSLGQTATNVWAAIQGGGPLVWLLGRRARNGMAYAGLWLQLIGDLVAGGALFVYTLAILADKNWGDGVFSPFISIPTIFCIALLAFRDGRRIAQVEKQVQVEKRACM